MRAARAEERLAAVALEPAAWPKPPVDAGWHADLGLRFAPRRTRTVLVERRHRGPLTVQRPFYPEGDGVCHAYVLHPPAGIVGGDDLRMSFVVEPGAHAVVTTPAATRWYWSRGVEARVLQHATVADGATFEWLPQETLVFAGAHARLATRIDLAGTARFCGWEILGLGRPACGEPFRDGRLDFRFELRRDGAPLLSERLRGGADGVPGLQGHAACATFLATPATAAMLDAARATLDAAAHAALTSGAPDVLAAATLIDDVLVVRALAARCEPLMGTFTAIWSTVRPLLCARAAAPPRIWHT